MFRSRSGFRSAGKTPMPGYRVKHTTITVAGLDYTVRSLLDLQQFADPEGEAERLGISSASWSLFGQVWPSARVLALAMQTIDLDGRRVLELGAGLALSSLVIHRRAGDVTVSDLHPLSRSFLAANLVLNGLTPLPHDRGDWAAVLSDLGLFDLIIGSDVLYEPHQPALLAGFIDRHSARGVEVVIVDPDRGHRPSFCREMAGRGYDFTSTKAAAHLESGEAYKGRFLRFTRAG
jgi:hypothetical protein